VAGHVGGDAERDHRRGYDEYRQGPGGPYTTGLTLNRAARSNALPPTDSEHDELSSVTAMVGHCLLYLGGL
jgi:hypothetical protein